MIDQVTETTTPLLHVTASMVTEEAEAVAVKGHTAITIMTETETAVGETKNENSIRRRQIEVVPLEKEVEVRVGVAVQKEETLLGIVTEGGIIEEENNFKKGLWTLESAYRTRERQKI